MSLCPLKMLSRTIIAAFMASVSALLASSPAAHVAFDGPTGMLVSWDTADRLEHPAIRYGLSKGNMTSTASSPESASSGSASIYHHRVKITDLEPDTLYFYAPLDLFGDESTLEPYTFKTAKPAGNMDPYTIAFVCDTLRLGLPAKAVTDDLVDGAVAAESDHQSIIESLASTVDSYDFIVIPRGSTSAGMRHVSLFVWSVPS